MSVCRPCINDLYEEAYKETGSIERALHSLCVSLNVKFSNEAASATRANIETLLDNGKNVKNVFGIYKTKLIATQKTMDKGEEEDLTYADISTVYTNQDIDFENHIPDEIRVFWGRDLESDDIIFLQDNYNEFTKTHDATTHPQVVLLKEVCYLMLNIKKLRLEKESTEDEVKALQALMKSLDISPSSKKDEKTEEVSFGKWIQDIEQNEPAQWLSTDERGDMYRDVGNVEEYFNKYFVRPLKNFITGSKDFNVEDEEISELDDFDYKEGEELFSDILEEDEE